MRPSIRDQLLHGTLSSHPRARLKVVRADGWRQSGVGPGLGWRRRPQRRTPLLANMSTCSWGWPKGKKVRSTIAGTLGSILVGWMLVYSGVMVCVTFALYAGGLTCLGYFKSRAKHGHCACPCLSSAAFIGRSKHAMQPIDATTCRTLRTLDFACSICLSRN